MVITCIWYCVVKSICLVTVVTALFSVLFFILSTVYRWIKDYQCRTCVMKNCNVRTNANGRRGSRTWNRQQRRCLCWCTMTTTIYDQLHAHIRGPHSALWSVWSYDILSYKPRCCLVLFNGPTTARRSHCSCYSTGAHAHNISLKSFRKHRQDVFNGLARFVEDRQQVYWPVFTAVGTTWCSLENETHLQAFLLH